MQLSWMEDTRLHAMLGSMPTQHMSLLGEKQLLGWPTQTPSCCCLHFSCMAPCTWQQLLPMSCAAGTNKLQCMSSVAVTVLLTSAGTAQSLLLLLLLIVQVPCLSAQSKAHDSQDHIYRMSCTVHCIWTKSPSRKQQQSCRQQWLRPTKSTQAVASP